MPQIWVYSFIYCHSLKVYKILWLLRFSWFPKTNFHSLLKIHNINLIILHCWHTLSVILLKALRILGFLSTWWEQAFFLALSQCQLLLPLVLFSCSILALGNYLSPMHWTEYLRWRRSLCILHSPSVYSVLSLFYTPRLYTLPCELELLCFPLTFRFISIGNPLHWV